MPHSYTLKVGNRLRPDPDKYIYMVDTFWYNCDSSNYDDVIKLYYNYFLEGRNAVADGDEILTLEVDLPQYDQPISFQIQSGQKPNYSFSIRSNDVAIYFAKSKRKDDQYPMKVQLNQFILWEKGLKEAYYESLQVLMALGFDVGQSKLNRIDFAVHTDQYQPTFKDMKSFYYPQNFSGSETNQMYGIDFTKETFQTYTACSRKRRQLRIYNKSIEIEYSKKYFFYEIYEKYGLNPNIVWNFELELRRPFFRELVDPDLGINIYDDLELCFAQDGINQLFQFGIKDFGFHKNAFWSTLISNPNNTFGSDGFRIFREKNNNWSVDKEVGQLYGRFRKFLLFEDDCSLEHAIDIFKEKVIDYEKKTERTFSEEVLDIKALFHDDLINQTIKKSKAGSASLIEWKNS